MAAGVLWQHRGLGDPKPLGWRDQTAALGRVPWPHSIARTFWKPGQLSRFLHESVPHGTPRSIPLDYLHRRAILIAAGPRSSGGYEVHVVRVVERRDRIEVVVRESTPTTARPGRPGLTFPYRLITIPSTSKRVYVRWEGRP